jgi:hypothetical protein
MRSKVKFKGFVTRFITIHLIIYIICLLICLFVTDYKQAISLDEIFSQIFREIDTTQLFMIPLIQIIRSFLIAAVIYPFHSVIIHENYGWIKLFLLLFVLTGPAASIIGIGSLEGYLYTFLGISSPIMGLAQIAVVKLFTSFIFVKWMKKSLSKTRFYGRY